MRLHRFYVLQPLGEEVVIDDVSKIKQWTKVFRYKQEDSVILFNGEGFDIEYSITSISSKLCTLKHKKQTSSYIPERKVTLYLALIKKDAFEFAVQKATELGVTAIIPIISERSLEKNLNIQRLNLIAIEAAEQCGRGDIPQVFETITFIHALLDSKKNDFCIVLEKDSKPVKEIIETLPKKENVGLFVGPEGGWTVTELENFSQYGVASASLGKTVLRAETAAIVASSLLM